MFASTADSETPAQDMALQMRLVHDGFSEGPVDGHVGKKTKAAIADYAAKNGLLADRASVEQHMLSQAEAHRITPIGEADWIAGVEGAKLTLNDPYSAKFTQLYSYKSSSGRTVVCGLVNAKNLYGAYVGDQFFQALVFMAGNVPMALGNLEGSDQYCLFGVSSEDFRK
ncbi:peptidoglycan-binding protein [Cypionkella sp.]|uniref:peptidoglycan-binding domain-containing protein n=1 Tax=Cypionkella sp. TaxID=2811411 RepID=UPI00272AD138|nr:peptidoglycan-binding domain-containing protein [Cypionkella sp.]